MRPLIGYLMIACVGISEVTADTAPVPPSLSQMNICDQEQPISISDSVDRGWTFDASFLYWNAKVDGYQFAEDITLKGISGGAPTLITAHARQMSPRFKTWDPGFQIGLGYLFPEREQWHPRLSWSRFTTSSHRSVKDNLDNIGPKHLIPILVPFLTGPIANKASAHWDLEFNTLDLELDRAFFVGEWLSLCPRIGLRAAWIEQDYKVKYNAIFPTNGLTFISNTSFKTDQDFSGIGLKIGSDAEFYMGKSWSIIGNIAASLLWGKFDIKEKIKGLIVPDPSFSIPEHVNLTEKLDVIRANIEGQLGLRWQLFYHHGKYRLACSTLYSFSYWFKQNIATNLLIATNGNVLTQPQVQTIGQAGDLQIQGMNIRFDFDF